MNGLDLVVIAIYMTGLIGMGAIFARMSDIREMFAAGGQSPWWLSGLSAFMTTFSAGTFVVWGGIAYQQGLVGVFILLVIGIAAIVVGRFLADRWKNFGYDSAAEFIEDRFGRSLVQFYTWLQGTVGLFTMGGAVYALSVIVCTLIPLPEGHFLADPETGNFSVTIASLIICTVVIAIATGGGLWAVLMTDALQFIILSVSVLFVIPLIISHIGGPAEFIASAPEGFFSPVSGEFTWWFLAGWCLVFCFKLGGEWAYVQRFACVPSGGDARKSYYLFGILYLVSPLIWMLPPMAYRIIEPGANYEQAYILASQTVLPAGMLGLMVSAMCSATASMATTQLNVYAGAFTTEFYKGILRPSAHEKELVMAGRIISVLLGGIIIGGAMLIPRLGTYTGYILGMVAMLTGPLVLPTIWGLFSRKIGLTTAWTVTIMGVLGGVFVKLGFREGGWFEGVEFLSSVTQLLQANERITEIVMGAMFPLLLLVIAELLVQRTSPGWHRVITNRNQQRQKPVKKASVFPARLCGWSACAIAFLMTVIAFLNPDETFIIGAFAAVMFLVGIGILKGARMIKHRTSEADSISGAANKTNIKESELENHTL
jgi:Na+/proline symporter